MQGKSDPNAELLDAAALCGHLVPEGSVAAFLAERRRHLFQDECSRWHSPVGRPTRSAAHVVLVGREVKLEAAATHR